ncbi:MAG TPA: hypothetical protein VMT16_01065 [Thermoanaerobaculia bacterium]|nr:hypothetical protein [Thermoanaerobaculia bacterium]
MRGPLHRYQPVRRSRVALRSELVNPNADPGALYLSADFQPDWDYGLRQTVYETTTLRRCERCGGEDVVRAIEAEIDE